MTRVLIFQGPIFEGLFEGSRLCLASRINPPKIAGFAGRYMKIETSNSDLTIRFLQSVAQGELTSVETSMQIRGRTDWRS